MKQYFILVPLAVVPSVFWIPIQKNHNLDQPEPNNSTQVSYVDKPFLAEAHSEKYELPFGRFLFSVPLASQMMFIANYSSNMEKARLNESAKNRPPVRIPGSLVFKAGYFFFSESIMKKVFKNGGLDLQISGSYPIAKYLQIYGSVEYLRRSGHSLGGDQKTYIWEAPISLGLRPIFPIKSRGNFYFALGPRYFFVHVHNFSSSVPKVLRKNGCGGFVNTGFLVRKDHFTFDVFGEYSYKQFHFHSDKPGTEGQSVDVGGFTFGGGFGYSF